MFLCFFCLVIVFINNYRRIRTSKISFIQGKKIKQLLEEQQKIFQQLPDGAIIYKTILAGSEEELDSKVKPDSVKIDIRYLNDTFKEMFTSNMEKQK